MAVDPQSNSLRFSISRLLSFVTLVAVGIGGCITFFDYANGMDTIATIDCGSGRKVIISVARSWEVSQPIYFQIRENGKVVVPTRYLDSRELPASSQFTYATSKQGDVVGVAYARSPTSYLFVHDFSSGKTYVAADRLDLKTLLDKTFSVESPND